MTFAPALDTYKKKRRSNPEHELQVEVTGYLSTILRPDCWFTSIDHGTKNSAITGAKLKHRGVKAGIPDMMILTPACVLFIELKAGTNTLSDAQRAFERYCIDYGHPHAVCRSVSEVIDFLELWEALR